MTMGLIRWGEAAFDGPRVKGSNSRYRTLTTATLAERWKRIEQQIAQMLSEVEAAEAATDALAGEVRGGKRATQWTVELTDLKTRQEKRKGALAIAHTQDESRRQNGVDPAQNPAQVPVPEQHRALPEISRNARASGSFAQS